MRLERLSQNRGPEVVRVLCDAFAEYPTMRFILGSSDRGCADRLQRLIGFFVQARMLRNEPVLGVVNEGHLAAAALVSLPGLSRSPSELAEVRAAVWRELGSSAQARYEAYSRTYAPFGVSEPHVHLNMIGVLPAFQGSGLGRRLMHAVEEFARDSGLAGVALTTEDPANVPFYRAMGYAIRGHASVAPELETWVFFRAIPRD